MRKNLREVGEATARGFRRSSRRASLRPAPYSEFWNCSAWAGQRHRGRLDPFMVQSFLLLMYGAALRTSEALSLKNADVDLTNAVLTVRDSKFFMSRLVPLGARTVQILADYADRHRTGLQSRDADTTFFLGRNAKRVNISTLETRSSRSGYMPACAARAGRAVSPASTTSGIRRRSTGSQRGIAKARTFRNCCRNCRSIWDKRIWRRPRYISL
jgi:integrase